MTDMGDETITISTPQRERIERIKDELTEDGRVPRPSDEHVLDSLLDTWHAVNQGYYND